jgi:hypothetical protein
MARRRSGDDGHPSCDRRCVPGCAESAERAGVRVDHRCGHRDARRETEIGRRGARQRAEPFAGHPDARTDLAERIRRQVAETDRVEIRRIPPSFVAEIGPFAHGAAQRSVVAAGCAPGEIVGQIEPARGALPGLRKLAFHPTQLRRLHFRRDHATDVVEHAVRGCVDRRCVADRAVIHPDDDVALVAAIHGYADRVVARVERSE